MGLFIGGVVVGIVFALAGIAGLLAWIDHCDTTRPAVPVHPQRMGGDLSPYFHSDAFLDAKPSSTRVMLD